MAEVHSNRSQAPGGNGETRAIYLQGISKSFGFRKVLSDVSLEIRHGTCLAVYGHNGAGKSTLARIISTQWAPSSGSGEVLGHSIGPGNKEIRAASGWVGDQSFLRTELSLEENLLFFGSLYGVVDAEHSRSLLEKFGLYTRRRDPISTYSQGMIKRANLIRSLLHHPELWVLDEPFGGLDQEGQALLKGCIRDYTSRGRTVLLVTHHREIGEELASASVEIQQGFIVGKVGLDEGGEA